ncbi:astacin (Peptidase family m12A) domain-containing protein [Ditylenchus destructor]|nr:astacin (Peptidase family m12A) domain-containing protein [Ditylenchus destructor]
MSFGVGDENDVRETQRNTLIDRGNISEETRKIRHKFFDEILSDPKFSKMRKHLQHIKDHPGESASLQNPSANALQSAKVLQAIDRSRDKNVVRNTPTISHLNRHISDLLIGGDVLLSDDLMGDSLNESNESSHEIRKRQVVQPILFGRNKWSTYIGISYIFAPSIDENTRRLIRLSAEFWTSYTCVTFVENGPSFPKLRFVKGQGCYSEVGKDFRTLAQDISIGEGCETFGTITHEMGHALGFFHHHARTDRDQNVTIMTNNIEPGWTAQYTKESNSNNEGVPYDYGSVMHYTGFRPHSDTVIEMLANDKKYQHTMGNNYGPIYSDLLAINKYYNCIARCSSGADCKHDGFRNSRNCNECICPNGFGGADCSERALGEGGAPQDCGETVQAESFYKLLNGTVNPVVAQVHNISDRSAGCHYHIQAPEGSRIEVELVEINGTCSPDCYFGALELKVDDYKNGGVRMCCDSHKTELGKLVSRTNLVIVSLYSQRGDREFSVRYKIYEEDYDDDEPPASPSAANPGPPSNPRAVDDSLAPAARPDTSTTTTTRAPPAQNNCFDLAGPRCTGWLIKLHCQWRAFTRAQCQKFCGLC